MNRKATTLWERLNRIAEEKFHKSSFPTLTEDQMMEALDQALTPKPKRKTPDTRITPEVFAHLDMTNGVVRFENLSYQYRYNGIGGEVILESVDGQTLEVPAEEVFTLNFLRVMAQGDQLGKKVLQKAFTGSALKLLKECGATFLIHDEGLLVPLEEENGYTAELGSDY